MGQINTNWPDDADGDVFRRLFEHGFDFSTSHTVDYNIDFDAWPPPSEAIDALRSIYGVVALYEPDDLGQGYAQFQIYGPVTYETVTSVQRRASSVMASFGGICESWGVTQDAP
jgi:Regulator of ribonuclease activity B